MNNFLGAAPDAVTICSVVELNAFSDHFSRPARALADGEELSLGSMNERWLWTPHAPHGWGTGFLFETSTSTLFAGDLFTQHGGSPAPLMDATADIESLNLKLFDITDYWPRHAKSAAHLKRLQELDPAVMLVMHGSSFKGECCGDMIGALGALRAMIDA